jgi:hypothetical protein
VSGWAELVGQQIAAQQGAEALARAARGESYGDVSMEGPRIGYRAEERAPAQLLERPTRALPPPPPQALTARDQETLWRFCEAAADLMADMGARFSPPDVARILSRLTSEGWVIDVDRQGR